MKRIESVVLGISISIALSIAAPLTVYNSTLAANLTCISNPCTGTAQNDNLTAVCVNSPNGTTVQANDGDDIVSGSACNDNATDILRGGSGNDTFKCFTHLLDHAVDYKAGKDSIIGDCGLSAPRQ